MYLFIANFLIRWLSLTEIIYMTLMENNKSKIKNQK